MTTPLHNERGMVLLLVLLVVALLSGILTDWASSTLVDLRLAETFRDSNRAYYLARGGVEAGKMLIADDRNNYDGAGELWAQGIPSYPVADGAAVSITIEDQDGRLDLNRIVDATGINPTAHTGRLLRLLRQLDLPEAESLKDALFDWLDKGDSSEARGAESAYYRTLSPPYAAKNGWLDTVDELRLVRGFTPEVVAKLAPFVTALPASAGSGKLNLNSAPREVLLCWQDDVNMALIAEEVLKGREGAPYQSNEDVKKAVGIDHYAILNREVDTGVVSDYYRIEARGEVGDGRRTVEALLKKNGSSILYQRVY